MAVVHSVIQPVIGGVFSSPTESMFYDPDAGDYFKRIMAAGSSISANNKAAVARFIIGCKADGIWNAIRTSCILAASDTLAGALVPLKGAAPTNVGPFDAGDYSRTLGLIGNGTTKYLDTNCDNANDPRNSNHNALWLTTVGASGSLMGTLGADLTGRNTISTGATRNRNNGSSPFTAVTGFVGINRGSADNYTRRNGSSTATLVISSEPPTGGNLGVLRIGTASGNSRVAFYSKGESLDLDQLDARLTTLMASIA